MRALAVCLFGLAAQVVAQPEFSVRSEAKTWRIHGRAVDEHGKAIEDVSVSLDSHDEFTTAATLAGPRVKTAADGRFALTVEHAWRYLEWRAVVLAANGRTTVLVRPDGQLEIATGSARRAIDVGDIILHPAVTLRGRVRATGDRPIPRARVVAGDPLARLVAAEPERHDPALYSTATTTNDAGDFELTGVLADGVQVVVTAEGHYRRDFPFVLAGDALVVELTPGGFVEGIVRDTSGRPSPGAHVWTQSVAGAADLHVADAEGRFRFTLPFPYGCRLDASTCGDRTFGLEPAAVLLEGPAKGVELTTGPAVDPQRALVVRVVDAETDKALEEVHAAVFWLEPDMFEFLSQGRVLDALVPYRTASAIHLPGPGRGYRETGMVVVKATGYAPHVTDIAWSDTDRPRVEVKLARESVLVGEVVDARSGEPVEGALVLVDADCDLAPWEIHHARRHDDLRMGVTDAVGRFRIGSLAAGRHRLRAAHPRRAPGEAIEIELGPAETRGDVALTSPEGSTLTGRLTGVAPGARWEVQLWPLHAGRDHDQDAATEGTMSRRAVGPNGSFEVPGLAAGDYGLRLSIPHRGGRYGYVAVDAAMDPRLRIRTADVERDFDVRASLPGTVRGRVTFTGADVPRQRLVVAAFVVPAEVADWTEQPYVLEPLAADGSFALPAVSGEQRLEVIDLATRVPLATAEGVSVASGETTTLSLRVELVSVRVHLRPEREGGPVVASRLEVIVQHERYEPEPPPLSDRDTGVGVALAGRADDIELLLPRVPTRLVVHSNHARVYEDEWLSPPLGEVEFTPKKDTADRIEIAVRTPPKPGGK